MDRILSIIGRLGKQAGDSVRKVTPVSGTVKPDQAGSFLAAAARSSQNPHRYGATRRKPYSGLFERDST